MITVLLVIGCVAERVVFAQEANWTELASFNYGIAADVVYGHANNTPLLLDVWQNMSAKEPVPTLMYIHGGGWMIGDKGGASNLFLPYIQRGWNVVNVEYRLGGNSSAPGAVEDSRCALRWIYDNADRYHFDLNRIVVSGHSAGGHLALMVGMLPEGTDLDSECPADADARPLKVAAIVNWYGITDVDDLLQGPDRKTYAVAWVGANPEKHKIAEEVSPLTYVRRGLPPIITIHGDHDPTVPYSHAARLKKALDASQVPNKLITIPGGVHGSFSNQETLRAFTEIWKFLGDHDLDAHAEKISPK
jgi:acetyl esterase/lipase